MEKPNEPLTIYQLAEKLTAKQRIFCKEYVVELNATQSAIRAGYSENSAKAIGSENLTKPDVVAYIDALRADLSFATGITKHMVLFEYKKMAFTDLSGLYNEWGQLKQLSELTDEQRAIIQEIEVNGDKVKIKGYSKVSALQEISKILGFYAPTRTESKVDATHAYDVELDDYL